MIRSRWLSRNVLGATVVWGGCWMAVASHASAAEAAKVSFQHEVRPILSDACFLCHGPDSETRMAGLRLDVRDGAFGKRPTGVPIVPGDPEQSLVYQRISHEKKAMRMPPVYSHKELTGEQIELIRHWIEQGAPWSGHWAFEAPKKSEPPVTKDANWARNPLDRFALARLEAEGLKPNLEADRRTLIRRVTLDLTGLPPTPEAVEAFVNDPSPKAYETLVDRLLETDAWGEHRARYWLDAARYADTHGLHIDNYREMWPYRDWVIGAFNRNLPFDRFTTEQLAGDLLPNPTMAQLIASGFHRCNITTNEGGVIDDEVAAMYAKDRADTTGAVWLGLTVGCATCHDHKFDPIKQSEFYALTAFFRNTTQHPRDGNIYDTPPVIVVPSERDRPRWDELRSAIPEQERQLAEARKTALAEIESWIDARKYRRVSTKRFDRRETLSVEVGRKPRARLSGKSRMLRLSEGVSIGAGPEPGISSLRFGGKEAFVEVPGFDGIRADQPFSISAWFYIAEKGGGMIASQSDPEDEQRGWRFDVSGGRPRLTFTGDDGDDLGVRATKEHKTAPDGWHHVVVTYDGFRQRSGISVYIDGEPAATEPIGNVIRTLEGELAPGLPFLLGRQNREEGKSTGFNGGALAEFRVFDRPVNGSEARLLASWSRIEKSRGEKPATLTADAREALGEYYLVREHKPYRREMARLEGLLEEERAIRRRNPVAYVMQERADSKPKAHVLFRGMYDQPREEVAPGTPAVLPPMRKSFPRNRLGLAQWLLDESNPLTARVTVNRFWQEVFGTGLVETSEDFGSQGSAPTHPELLDWLAVEFRETGWDVKRLFRLMTTSATYRQSPAISREKLEKDPDNRLLSRGPRFRMDGEMVRDYALAVSGLLGPEIGGPSVKPYQPEGLWKTVAMKSSNTRYYRRDSGESLYRRSLYTFWKRSAPPPSLQIFNAPTREHCTVRRERTNTPLQALVTMNDPQFFEAARHLAQRAMASSGDMDGRLDYMAIRLLARPLGTEERPIVQKSYREFLVYYDTNPEEARRALSAGESESPESLGRAELAALTMVANQLMNLDEVLNQ